MRVVRVVLADLAEFAFSAIAKRARKLLPARQARLALPGVQKEPTVLLTGGAEPLTIEEALAPIGVMSEQRHFVADTRAQMYVYPTITFDSALAKVPYGTEVVVHRFEGRFASVTFKKHTGWILKDVLYADQSVVFPQFTVGVTYDQEHPSTKKLRDYIEDSFTGAVSHTPLTSVEYVSYRLARRGRTLNWSVTRPRPAGEWQQLLRGQRDVHIGIVPKTGSVIEYQGADGGHIGYVEAVAPDGTIRVSMIDDHDASRYLEVELPEESWKELRPVFIQAQ